MDLDSNCITKKDWKGYGEQKAKVEGAATATEKEKPAAKKVAKPKLVKKVVKKRAKKTKVPKNEGLE